MGDRSKVVNDKIGGKIRELRKRKGWTQLQLSEKVHKGDSTVRMWELGKSEPDNETVTLLAHIFGVSSDYLLGKSAEEMYNNFVETMHNDFGEVRFDSHGEPYEVISDEVEETIRAKLDILFRIKDINDVGHLSLIYNQVAKWSAVEDFSAPLPLDENGEPPASSISASPDAVKLQNEVIALVRQIKNTSSLEVLLDFTKARLAIEGEGDKK